MKRCRDELTYSGEAIEAPRFRCQVCELDGEIAGFYALEMLSEHEGELEGLFEILTIPKLIRYDLRTMY